MIFQNCKRQTPDGFKYCFLCGAKQAETPKDPSPDLGVSNSPSGQSAPEQPVSNPTAANPSPYSAVPPVPTPYGQPPVPSTSRRKQVGYVILSVAIFFAVFLGVTLTVNFLGISNTDKLTESDLPAQSSTVSSASSSEDSLPEGSASSSVSSVPEATDSSPEESVPETSVPSSEESLLETPLTYDEIFSAFGISYTPPEFPGMDSSNFVGIDEENAVIHCIDFGHQSNLVLSLSETIYYFIDGYTDSEREILDSDMRSGYAEYENLSFCSVTYDMDDLYYIVRLEFTDLNQVENYQKMIEIDMAEEGTIAISMDLTEEILLSEGYQKKP